METEISKAVRGLRKALRDDETYRQTWQANIAVCFQDEFAANSPDLREAIHKISNKAADRFLNLLMSTGEQ